MNTSGLGMPITSPLPELAAALRNEVENILRAWETTVRQVLPAVAGLTSAELRDNLPEILPELAAALHAGSARETRRLTKQSPAWGIARFRQRYDVNDVMIEDRILRRVILERAEAGLGRRMSAQENIALNTAVDEMFQQAVVAFVSQQRDELRAAAEAELKYLSFLSHDLNNNLGSVTLLLQVLRQELGESPAFAGHVENIDLAQRSIVDTITTMQRLLEAERFRKGQAKAKSTPLPLDTLASDVTHQWRAQAEKKGLTLLVQVPQGLTIQSDAELVGMVLRNLLGNAIEYSDKGTVRLAAERGPGGEWRLSVSDEGPGIAPEHLGRQFEAFRRGDAHGQEGVGLGLTIAAQAAKLLDARLEVESQPAAGSIFRLVLPATRIREE